MGQDVVVTEPSGQTSTTPSLALVGGAEFGDSIEHHRELFDPGTTVTVLPTAMAYEDPSVLLSRARSHLAELGVEMDVVPVYTRSDAHDPDLVARLEQAQSLYLTGGSPMHLRSVLHDSPLLQAGVRRWRDGMTVVAAAEATSVLCGHMVDNRGGAFTVGLGLITTFTVIARFDRWSPDKRHRTVALAPSQMPVVGIDEATALVRDREGNWTTRGSASVHVFRGGEAVELSELPREL